MIAELEPSTTPPAATPRTPKKKKTANRNKRREPASLGYDVPKGGGILRVPCGGGWRIVRRGSSYDGDDSE